MLDCVSMSSDLYTSLDLLFLSASPIHDELQGNNSLHPLTPSFCSFSPHQDHTLLHPQVTSEECQMSAYNHHPLSHAYETASNFIHRSFSCNSFEGNTFEAHPHTFMQWHSPENTFFTGQIRRVCSTGDLQSAKATDVSRTEEGNLKVGRYSAEERQQKISKYRAKRSQRKFNKIIKYACRKTLADNRTRIRGRFARNEEIKVSSSTSTTEECEDEFWVDFIEGLNDQVMG